MPAARKSAARKSLAGTERRDRKPRVDYAARLVKPPPPPRALSPDARRIWRQLAAVTTGLGVLTLADLPLLAMLTVTIEAEAAARAMLVADGPTIAAGSGGRKKNPAAAIAEAARSQALMMFREFGLSPKARQTVDTAPPAPTINPFLNRGSPPPRPKGGYDPSLQTFDEFLASKPGTPPRRPS